MSFFRTTRARTLRSNVCGSQCDKPCYSRRFMRLGYNNFTQRFSTIPGSPYDVEGTPGYKTATLSWSPPEYTGNFSISYYTVKNITLDISTKVKELTYTFTELSNIPYTFTISATNSEDYTSVVSESVIVTPTDVPGAPKNISGVSGDESITLSWDLPDSNGGSEITGYTITRTPGNITTTTADRTTIITGLTNGTEYTFTIVAINAVGTSSGTTSSAIKPGAVPDAPTIDSISRGNNTAIVNFTAPADIGGNDITKYFYSTNGDDDDEYTLAGEVNNPTITTPITITGLNNDSTYTVYLKAANIIGNSVATSYAIVAVTVPGAPTNLTASVADSSTEVSFTAPTSNGGNDITGYLYWINDGDYIDAEETTSPITITGLTNGTEYTIYLKAKNEIGEGTASNAITVTPGTIPVAPEITLVAGNTEITLIIDTNYSLSANNGGRTISRYEYSIDNGSNYTSASETTITITGLSNGVRYDLLVRAVNSIGTGPTTTDYTTPVA